jgi:hypothetical protein
MSAFLLYAFFMLPVRLMSAFPPPHLVRIQTAATALLNGPPLDQSQDPELDTHMLEVVVTERVFLWPK